MNSIGDFIKSFKDFDDVEEFIKKNKENNDKDDNDKGYEGYLYERLWDLVIRFLNPKIFISKLIDINDKDEIKHIDTNINKIKTDKLENYLINFNGKLFDKYLEKSWRSGNENGFSDISFKIKDTYFISSSKYFKNEKNPDNYDIEKLCVIIKNNNKYKIRCLLFIKNREEFEKKVKQANKSSSILIEYVKPFEKNVFDLNDLKPLYKELKKLFSFYNYFKTENDCKKFKKEYLKDDGFKQLLNLRFHQKLFINEIRKIIKKNKKTDILIGAVPRCGKTFIMGGVILDYLKIKKTGNNFIIITSAPSETIEQYKDMFNNYLDFEVNNIKAQEIQLKDIKNFSLDDKKNNVILISIQKLVKEKKIKNDVIEELDEDNYNKYIDIIKKYNFNIIFIDEAHHAQTTDKAINILKNKIKYDYKIFTTATFNKPIKKFDINYLLFWSLENVIKLKRLNDYQFDIEDFNQIINDIVKNCNFSKETIDEVLKELNVNINDKNDIIEKILKQYKNVPEPLVLTTIWNNFNDVYKHIELAKDSNYSFDMKRIFAIKKNEFENQEEIKELFCYYLGIPRETFLRENKKIDLDYKYRNIYKNTGIIPRIKNICLNNCRTLQKSSKTSQLWFLPFGTGLKLKPLMNALIDLFNTIEEFKSFFNETYFIVAKGKEKFDDNFKNVEYFDNSKGLKEFIIEKQKEINEDNKYKNLVILTGFKLHLGVSLPDVDIVVLFNQIQSIDLLYQMMFRSMTEVNEKNNKKYGFIVDLNPQRNMTFLEYDFKNIINKITDKQQIKFLITDLFNIDRDMFITEFDNKIKNKSDLKKYEERLKKFSRELFELLANKDEFNDNKFDLSFNEYFDKIYNNKELMKELSIYLKDYNKKENDHKKIKKGVDDKLLKKKNIEDDDNEDDDNEDDDNEDDNSDDDDKKEDNKLKYKIKKYFKDILNIMSLLSIKGNIKECCYIYDDYKRIIKEAYNILTDEIKLNDDIKNIFIYTINDRCGLNYNEDKIINIIDKLLKI
jgi:hypothetical protein